MMKRLGIPATLSALALALALGMAAAPPAGATCRTTWREAEAQYYLRNGTTCVSGRSNRDDLLQYADVNVPGTGVVDGAFECYEVVTLGTGFYNNTACTVPGSGNARRFVWSLRNAKGVWEQCAEGKEKEAPTKYTSDQCGEAAKSNEGKWQWDEATEKEGVKGVGFTLTLTDTKATGGASKIRCDKGLEETGTVGPGVQGIIESAEVSSPKTNCARVEGACKAGEVEKVEGVHLPWATYWTELTEKVPADLVVNGGSGEPGWEVVCVTSVGKTTDTCEGESTEKDEGATLENVLSAGVLLVTATYAKLHKEKCSIGGAESGEEEGKVALLDKSGTGLRQ